MFLEPIGVVKSDITEGVDENWGSVLSEIHLDPSFVAGLNGIDQFSHIVVVFYMNRSKFDPKLNLIRKPQGRVDMPEIGIFAQRAKHRPNPIGITAVKLITVQNNVITVKGLDAIDGTPILDLKPYYPVFDRIEKPTIPEWVERLMANYF